MPAFLFSDYCQKNTLQYYNLTIIPLQTILIQLYSTFYPLIYLNPWSGKSHILREGHPILAKSYIRR